MKFTEPGPKKVHVQKSFDDSVRLVIRDNVQEHAEITLSKEEASELIVKIAATWTELKIER